MTEKKNRVADFGKACCIYLGLLALLTTGGYALFCIRPPFPTFVWNAEGAQFAGPAAGFFLWFGLLFIRYARQNEEDRALLQKHTLRDGERAFVCGAVKPVGPLLRAPFTGEECVGYYYKVDHHGEGGHRSRMTDYEGYALSPFVIRSPLGDIRPVPEASEEFFHELRCEKIYKLPGKELGVVKERASAYLRTADFPIEHKTRLGDTHHKLEVVNGPGDFRIEWAFGAPPGDLDSCRLEERIIRPGEGVYAIGVYSAEGQTLLPDQDITRTPFHIVRGDEKTLAGKTRSRYTGAVVCWLIALAVASIYFFWYVPNWGWKRWH